MNINDILKENGLKVTKQRRLILETIKNSKNPASAEEIYESIKDDLKIDLSTVYRNLNLLEEVNLLLKTTNLDGISYYQLNDTNHKHFITCNNCHRKFLIENCPVHDLEEEIEKSTGFEITGHNFEFTGICPDCLRKFSK